MKRPAFDWSTNVRFCDARGSDVDGNDAESCVSFYVYSTTL